MTETASPAERYQAHQAGVRFPRLAEFRERQRFDLDPFQVSACESLENGRSVLVAAPTGAGKTVVADFAVHLAFQEPAAKVFYTAPMKALSNQKFQDFVALYGPEDIGLLTGDTSINPRARVVVMTTEVLRNMLYADSDLLDDLAFVVMDEVHYLADRFRGAVWEEVIIHLPLAVRLVSLSATVSNAEEFGDWLQVVRGETDVIVSEDRPVPLEQHVLMRSRLLPLFASTGHADNQRVNPELMQLAKIGGRPQSRRSQREQVRNRHGFDQSRMNRFQVADLLHSRNLLPAIFFVFSRKGCDQAVAQVLRSGAQFTDNNERDEIRETVEERCRTILDEDLAVLGYWDFLRGLERGVAAHHAGMLPAFKEVVEDLFRRKLVKVVFATETLALGINMPARTVVLEKLEKFNGVERVPITPGEYTQLTGRAGRRGIDIEGHAVIQWQPGLNPQAMASLASRRTYPLNSSFSPTYNMAVNLIDQFGRERTRDILESSFAQFQADRAVVDLAQKVRSQEESLAGFQKSMACDRGDFGEYQTLRRELSDLERAGAGRADTETHHVRSTRQQALSDLRARLKAHPCHGCPDRDKHARWAERWIRLQRENKALRKQIGARTGAVARVFDRVTDVLVSCDYLRASHDGTLVLTPAGQMLRRIYGERDLLITEALRVGAWEGLDAAGMAAMACALVYQPRRDDVGEAALPRGRFRAALEETEALWERLDALEREHRLPGSLPLSPALSLAMHTWASGGSLSDVLYESDLPAGDFIRWTKQTIDLLDQLSIVADGDIGRNARAALEKIRRGIVAYSSVA